MKRIEQTEALPMPTAEAKEARGREKHRSIATRTVYCPANVVSMLQCLRPTFSKYRFVVPSLSLGHASTCSDDTTIRPSHHQKQLQTWHSKDWPTRALMSPSPFGPSKAEQPQSQTAGSQFSTP